ncbi:two-component system, chemotaxis family, response regulator CheY [Mariprofundus micogutta]|uniref:diguanylate cyclase n=1 Tax=Mariprofundus micogutta TaxID=1921010 RepID=A0A1L8CM96_9PROT|nr:GGDEF domain-containing protein [Mariprofundus micogutta]GAV20024.1 two-component system, chemotaxis family, response regulator CheY [Mariprofundus micogutta]
MGTLREDPHRAVILGAGIGGTAVLEMLLEEELVTVLAVVDRDPSAPGLKLAEQHQVAVYTDVEQALKKCTPCVAFNMTGNEMVEAVVAEVLGSGGVIGGMEANLILSIINNLKKAKEDLKFQASHDPLTGLRNRRYMMEQLQQGVSQALRYRHPFTVVMLDLDHFKKVNDLHGHVAGDKVLSHMARVLRGGMRESDTPGRWGGEEFLVLLPHTDIEGAHQAAEQWLNHLTSAPLLLDNGASAAVSFSAGVASLDMVEKGVDLKVATDALLHLADARMYLAKEQGRNRVCAIGEPSESFNGGQK